MLRRIWWFFSPVPHQHVSREAVGFWETRDARAKGWQE